MPQDNTTTNPSERVLLNQEQAACLLSLTNHRTLSEWRRLKKGPPFVMVGRCVRYQREALMAWIASNTVSYYSNT
jgi:hypothetical protein